MLLPEVSCILVAWMSSWNVWTINPNFIHIYIYSCLRHPFCGSNSFEYYLNNISCMYSSSSYLSYIKYNITKSELEFSKRLGWSMVVEHALVGGSRGCIPSHMKLWKSLFVKLNTIFFNFEKDLCHQVAIYSKSGGGGGFMVLHKSFIVCTLSCPAETVKFDEKSKISNPIRNHP